MKTPSTKESSLEAIHSPPRKISGLKIIGIAIAITMTSTAIKQCVEENIIKKPPSKERKNESQKQESQENIPSEKEIQEGIRKGIMYYA